jgi:hypothetical protein
MDIYDEIRCAFSYFTNPATTREVLARLSNFLSDLNNLFLYGSDSGYASGDEVLDHLYVKPSQVRYLWMCVCVCY